MVTICVGTVVFVASVYFTRLSRTPWTYKRIGRKLHWREPRDIRSWIVKAIFRGRRWRRIGIIEKKITVEEVKETLNNCKTRSAQGNDEISYQLLKKLPDSFLLQIAALFSCCIHIGYFPEQGRIHDILHYAIFSDFYKSVTDGWTDGRTDRWMDGLTDGRTHPLIEMRGRI